ncbi:hypothetical protein JXM83_03490 [Candidatus Woesearchaeota archaeon]|nr:hypothetical protein [Candidatus Woesearchaeota archaeon]
MNKKAQAAMEFLMTYGWAILVVLAAIGALAYFGVLSPDKMLAEKTTFMAPLPNIDYAVVRSAGTVTIVLQNNLGQTIQVNNGTSGVSGTGDCATVGGFTASPNTVPNGEKVTLTWDCGALTAGGKFKSDLTFEYTNQFSGQTHPHSGSVTAKVS